jgi:predicted PurR-regulated permease PerM
MNKKVKDNRKERKKMSKKRLISLVVVIALVCLLTASVYAASATVFISQGQGVVHSASISATNGAKYSGWNQNTSGHSLYITLQSSSGSGWTDRKVSLMAIGSGATGNAWEPTGTHLWRVQLNPQWAFTDCDGWGRVENH